MDDTRLIHIIADTITARSDCGFALHALTEMLDDPFPPHDAIHLERGEKFLSAANDFLKQAGVLLAQAQDAIKSAAEPMLCHKRSCLGSTCAEPLGHEGEHRSEHGRTWTDESDRRTGDAIAKSMEGRRD